MDTYRNGWLDRSEDAEEAIGFDRDEEAVHEAPPPAPGQDERRMQVRAYNYWAGLLGGRNFPAVEDLDPASLPDFGPYSVLLDFTAGIDDPAVQFLGEKLAEECGTASSIKSLTDIPSRSLLSRITDHYMQILANQAPIGFEAEFVNTRDHTVLYRGILLPFSSDDDTIDFIYGVINWKELAETQASDELVLEIAQALEDMPAFSPLAHQPSEPMTEWADGPADIHAEPEPADVLDLAELGEVIAPDHGRIEFEEPAFGKVDADAHTPGETGGDMSLGDWLASARELAAAAKGAEDRTRQALYAAIGRAYDFSLAAQSAPDEYAALVAESGLTIQDRAPLTPLVKLVFGGDYDKTRLTEFAAALGHGHRLGLERGTFAQFLGEAPGGLKGIVKAERRLRREEAGKDAPVRENTARDKVMQELRMLAPRTIAELSGEGSEFTLLVARRLPGGEVVLLGEVPDDAALLERAARRLIG
jgi:hypothetical protein